MFAGRGRTTSGASFTAETLTVNDVVEVRPSGSVTVSVIVAAPLALAVGVTVTVRFAPLPEIAIFAVVTTAVLDEIAVTMRSAAALSMSATVMLSAPVLVSSSIV